MLLLTFDTVIVHPHGYQQSVRVTVSRGPEIHKVLDTVTGEDLTSEITITQERELEAEAAEWFVGVGEVKARPAQ